MYGEKTVEYADIVKMTDTAAFPDAVEASWSSGAPTLAPAGIAFLDDPSWGEWNGALAVAIGIGAIMI